MNEDWLYSPERLTLRANCLKILLYKFGGSLKEDGSPTHSAHSIYACVHDWVSQGNPKTDGIVKYYKAYYEKDRNS